MVSTSPDRFERWCASQSNGRQSSWACCHEHPQPVRLLTSQVVVHLEELNLRGIDDADLVVDRDLSFS